MKKKIGRPTKKDAPLFGQRLAALRVKSGLTQVELAKRLGMTQKAIDYYERRAEKPSIELLVALAEVFSVSTDEILGLKGKGNHPQKPGPTSQTESAIEQIGKLSKSKQQTVFAMIEGVYVKEFDHLPA